MGCCGQDLVKKLRTLQSRLTAKGSSSEAAEIAELAARYDRVTRRAGRIVSKMGKRRIRQGEKPADVERYYKECKKNPPSTAKGRVEEYCARVAWQIYCSHKNPNHPGCTEYGRTKKSLPK